MCTDLFSSFASMASATHLPDSTAPSMLARYRCSHAGSMCARACQVVSIFPLSHRSENAVVFQDISNSHSRDCIAWTVAFQSCAWHVVPCESIVHKRCMVSALLSIQVYTLAWEETSLTICFLYIACVEFSENNSLTLGQNATFS